jgi:hypothetical protein
MALLATQDGRGSFFLTIKIFVVFLQFDLIDSYATD